MREVVMTIKVDLDEDPEGSKQLLQDIGAISSDEQYEDDEAVKGGIRYYFEERQSDFNSDWSPELVEVSINRG